MFTATVKPMTVRQYRELCDALGQAWASARSAANLTERRREAQWVREAATRLMAAVCPRATEEDRFRADCLIDNTASWLIERGMNHGGPNA